MAELEQCTAEQVVDSVEAVVLSGRACTSEGIAAFVNHPAATVANAVAVAVKLGLLESDGREFRAVPPYDNYFAEASESHRIDVLRFALEGFPPYRYFKQRLGFHGDVLRAARETRLRFDYTNHEGEIRETLLSLGQFSGSLSYTPQTGYVLARSGAADEFLAAADAISLVDSSVDEFLRQRLCADAYTFIQDEQDDIIPHLRAAFAKVVADELDEATVLLISNACENFLVKLATEAVPAVDLNGASGIISKADRLHRSDVIAQKHMGYMTFLGQLRNAADHGIDSDVNLDWEVTPEAIHLGALALIAAIRSVVALSLGRAEF
ncbi:MAG: hypothetical protein ABSC51_11110 [Gaiellaceae bacterium]|jgi:hypothetical protein